MAVGEDEEELELVSNNGHPKVFLRDCPLYESDRKEETTAL